MCRSSAIREACKLWQADAIDGTRPKNRWSGVPGALTAAWLRLRPLDGLLCRDLGDRLFQHTICLFSGLRLESSNSTALAALDVVSQRLATFVLGTDCRV